MDSTEASFGRTRHVQLYRGSYSVHVSAPRSRSSDDRTARALSVSGPLSERASRLWHSLARQELWSKWVAVLHWPDRVQRNVLMVRILYAVQEYSSAWGRAARVFLVRSGALHIPSPLRLQSARHFLQTKLGSWAFTSFHDCRIVLQLGRF